MIAPRWMKVWADLWSNRVRTLLVVLSIAAGVFAVGLISGGFVIMLRDLDADYRSVNPHVATIVSQPVDDDTLTAAENVPGVARAEGRAQIQARIRRGDGQWASVRILGVPKLAKMQIDRLRPAVAGSELDLPNKEILIERSGLGLLPVSTGDQVTIEVPGTKASSLRNLRVAGTVYDVTAQSSSMSGDINAYVNMDTMEWLGGPAAFDRLLITTTERPTDEAHVRAVAQAVTDKIQRGERHVTATLVSRPGEHPNAAIIRGLVVLLVGLGVLAVLLSGFLVMTTINGLLGQQVRQIGIMKAMGADAGQISAMFLVLVLTFGGLALAIAALPSALAAYWAVGKVATFLNFNLGPFRMAYQALALQALVAFGVPLVAAAVPVFGGTRMTVRQALDSRGLSARGKGLAPATRRWHPVLVPRPVLLSFRNTFRRSGRLALTLATLTLAGAMFIAVFNVRASFSGMIDDTLGYFLSNVNVNLNRTYRTQQIEDIASAVPGVSHVESWGVAPAQVLAVDEKTAIDSVILAPPTGSRVVKPVLTAGRWLEPGDQSAIVVGNQLTSKRPDLKVGDTITTRILGKKYDWHVVGIFQMAGNGTRPLLYAGYEDLTHTLDEPGRAGTVHVVTEQQDGTSEARVARALEAGFRAAGLQVTGVTTGAEQRAQEHAGIDILIYFLIGMAVLIAIVGGLGLMGTMTMNVMERTHEIGVLRAIGASTWSILRLVILEGLAIGLISWTLGAALALPVSKVLSDLLGRAIVSTPLQLVVTLEGFGLWLAAVLLLSTLASLWPAYRAAQLTVREILAYE